MSVVDNYILITQNHILPDPENGKDVDELNRLIEKEAGTIGGFVRVDQHSGGSKNMEQDVYLFSPNFFSLERLIECLHQVEWEDPDYVTLIHTGQNDDVPHLWSLSDFKRVPK